MSELAEARRHIPVPKPLADCIEVEMSKHSGPLRSLAVPLVHHARSVQYLPMLLVLLAARPAKTAASLALYWGLLTRLSVWSNAVQRVVAYGSSNRPRWMLASRKPADPQKQYMLAMHPHGWLCDSIFNACARAEPNFREEGRFEKLVPGVRGVLCFAPAVQWYPLYGELCGTHCTDSSAATVRKVLSKGYSPLVCPGGFSEAVYTGASPDYDYAFLEGRVGFLKLAIEQGIDIIPYYAFGIADMYTGFAHKRHERAVWSQNSGLPGILPWGKYGSSMPLTEEYCTVGLEPFPTSKYTVAMLEECAQDYAQYLTACFEEYKHCLPSQAHKRLVVLGKDVNEEMALGKLGLPRSRL